MTDLRDELLLRLVRLMGVGPGGPKCYPGRDMQESHAHLFATDFEFTIVAGEIAATPSSAIGRWLSEALPEDVPPDSGPSLATGSR